MKKFLIWLLEPIRYLFFRLKWRKINSFNETRAVNRFHLDNVSVGRNTYGPLEVLYDAGNGKLSIGSYCSIADNVKFFLGGGHNYKRISTFHFQTKTYMGLHLLKRDEYIDIVVEDDVWIGYDVIVLAGSKIGKGSVVGARSIVSGEIPPYSIYVGNKVIKQRFPENVISKIKDIDFSKVEHNIGDKYQSYCTQELNESNVDEILRSFV